MTIEISRLLQAIHQRLLHGSVSSSASICGAFLLSGMIAIDTWRKPINYPLSLTLSALAGCLWIIFSEREERQRQRIEAEDQHLPDPFFAGVTAFVFALLAARAGYVVLHMSYFQLHPLEAVFFWEGGLSGVAGGAGALIGLGAYTLRSRGNFWQLGDALAVPIQFVLLGSWAGCWFEGCAYGSPTDLDVFLIGTDPYDLYVQRWPTQGTGVILSVVSFISLTWLGEEKTPTGLRFALSLTTGAFSAAFIGLYRSDPVLLLGPARLDTWGYAVLAIAGMLMMSTRLYTAQKT
ncbi:MAG: prolipoprotein diacylglyceryl transferase [Anaerolineales bacterium]|jgi:phosphatidylglycerol:prolipoprotein diacylglycerol transferase